MRKSAESVETTVPRDTPHDWRRTTLGDIGEYINGRGFKKSEWAESGLPIIRIQNLTGTGKEQNYYDGEIDERHVVNPGDLLISWAATLGAYLWTGPQAALNQHIFKVRSHVDKKFHYYLMQHILSDLYRQTHGSGMVHITKSKFDSMPVVVPNTEDGQKRIVAEIEKQFSRLDEAVANLKRVKANLKRYKAAVLKAAVEGRLVETETSIARREGRSYETGEQLLQRILESRRSQWKGKGKYKEPAAPDTTDLPELPEGWVWVSVQQIAKVQLGKMLDKQKHRAGKELIYLRNINVRWGSVDTSNLLTMFFKDTEITRYGLEAGDVLVCEGGEPGRASIWNGQIPGMMYQKALHRVRFLAGYEQKLLVFHLEYLAKSGRLERWYTGSTIKHFTGESFAQLTIPLPPYDEQWRVVSEIEERLSNMEILESQVDANIVRAERLRQSLLGGVFSLNNRS